jgi:transcriptional regulator with XRE-family HTH domain
MKKKTKNISKTKNKSKTISKKKTDKIEKPKKPLTEKQKARVKQKINIQSVEVKTQKKLIREKQKGYFKGDLTGLLVKSFTIKNPDITKKELSKGLGISQQTLNKILKGKQVKLDTLKKVGKGLNSFSDSSKQIELTLIAEHLKRYKTISSKKLQAIKEKVKKNKTNIDKLPNKEFLFFKLHYSQSRLKILKETIK